MFFLYLFFFKQKAAYDMRMSDWSSDVCSSDLTAGEADGEILRTDMCSRHLVGDRLHRGQGILDAVIEFPDQKLLQFFRAFAFPDVTCHLGCADHFSGDRKSVV